MPKFENDPIESSSSEAERPAVLGTGEFFEGIRGISHNAHGGVVGINDWHPRGKFDAIRRWPDGSDGPGAGGWFVSDLGEGVRGTAKTAAHAGVVGINTAGGTGVFGKGDIGIGVEARSSSGMAVWGASESNEGGHFETQSVQTAALAAFNRNADGTGAAIYASKDGGKGHAGFFVGNVWVDGELGVQKDVILAGADCAEDFDVACDQPKVEPGSVMVLGEDSQLYMCCKAYDRRVVGVTSGAGDYRPAIILDKQRSNSSNRLPIALLGKVFCKVDADIRPILVGDLLTTSEHAGHAMKADDQAQAAGAVIGKALRALPEGTGLIPILVWPR